MQKGVGVDACHESKANGKYLGDYFDKLWSLLLAYQISPQDINADEVGVQLSDLNMKFMTTWNCVRGNLLKCGAFLFAVSWKWLICDPKLGEWKWNWNVEELFWSWVEKKKKRRLTLDISFATELTSSSWFESIHIGTSITAVKLISSMKKWSPGMDSRSTE
jgi:hypothetical protein